MDMLRVPNNKHKLIEMLIYSLSALSPLKPPRLCKTINSKGTLRPVLYTLFILTNVYDALAFFPFFEARNAVPNKYITAQRVVGVKENRLTEEHGMTSGQIHHGDLSKEMDPQFCPLPSYSAFQFMLCLSFILLAVRLRNGPMLCICKRACHFNQNQKRQSKEWSIGQKCERNVRLLLYLY